MIFLPSRIQNAESVGIHVKYFPNRYPIRNQKQNGTDLPGLSVELDTCVWTQSIDYIE